MGTVALFAGMALIIVICGGLITQSESGVAGLTSALSSFVKGLFGGRPKK